MTSVALGAGLTVLLATRIGMPISTTHSLVGALVGAGWAAGSTINVQKLSADFFLPLLASPALAIVATGLLYPALRFARRSLGVNRETCFCVGTHVLETAPAMDSSATMQRVELLTARMGDAVTCREQYAGQVAGIDAAAALDRMHYLSAGIVSFARGLNDTPKIAALLLIAPVMPAAAGVGIVAAAIALGGVLSARRVADLMSRRITAMNHGQGFTANLVTGLIVIAASRLGMPVSTTHVSCGALFGIGTVTGAARWRTIGTILLAWVTTLPVAAGVAALTAVMLNSL